MRESIRCCISCILPCGSLDVIRIVHANGRVEEISHAVRAGEVMEANPKHVLKKPPSSCSELEACDAPTRAVILPPNAELQRGEIYFLMPVLEKTRLKSGTRRKKKRREQEGVNGSSTTEMTRLLVSGDQYLSEILSEKVSSQKDRRRGRVGIWRPHLESISEVITNDL